MNPQDSAWPAIFFMVFWSLTTGAATNLTESTPRVHQLETIIVQAERILPLDNTQDQKELLNDARNISAAQSAQQVSGVGSSCRSVDAPEISIRGLGWERVPSQLDFLPLYGSCPARMDPPATYLAPESIDTLTLVKGLPSVTYGSGGTGGRVMARSIADPARPALNGSSANAGLSWNGGRNGYTSRLNGQLGNGTMEAVVGLNAVNFSDYESGAGKTVPAENQSYGASTRLRYTPDEHSGYFINWNLHKVDHLDYPALPMDATDVTSHTLTWGGRHLHLGETLQALEWQAGLADSSHLMDNALKPNRAAMEAEADTDAETFGGRIASDWQFSDAARWTLGMDAHHLTRDGTRTRTMVASGATLYDPIWPDATQGQLGFFAERTAELSIDQQLRIGLRADVISSAIERGHEATPFDATVKDGYARYYGSDAYDTDRNECLLGGNILWEFLQGDRMGWFAGAGLSQRAASITERFYAYAPAPGGFQVGNPTLDPESKAELDGGFDFYGDTVELRVHAYAAHIRDYILETQVDTLASGAIVRGFENTDALLAGGELDGRWTLSDEWSIPFSLAYVRGRNLSNHRDLPLIPPLSGNIGVRWASSAKRLPWAELTLRAATKQQDIDADYAESETPGYQVFDLRAGLELPHGFGLTAGIENLFDQDYTDHLARETLFAAGDLSAGEKIPMPGRFFYAGLNWTL